MGARWKAPKGEGRALRLSVSLESALHTRLERIANRNRVSIAWVIRYACEKLLQDAELSQLKLPFTDEET